MLDDDVSRHARRKAVFMREGLDPDEAQRLADQMATRDRDPFDNRRVCFECKHYARVCTAIKIGGRPLEPLRFILQRCDEFRLKGAA